jgi:hypothetical protein
MTEELIHTANPATMLLGSTRLEAPTTLVKEERRRPAGFYAPQCRKHSEARTAAYEDKSLRRLITICAWCNKIRTSEGLWQQLETDFRATREAKVSHGILSRVR